MLIIFFAIPCLGSLFVYHEYNVPGSLFPPAEEVVYFGHGESRLFVRNIPRLRHVLHSIFLGFLSVIQQAYAIPVFSMGSQINLIAFNFFTITTIAVYTANMASILTQKAAVRQVSSLDEAVKKGYRFCAERDQYSIIHSLHGTDPKAFVPDDDGLPGFSDKRLEVLTRIDVVKAAHDKRYCHAALTFTQDLDVYRAQGLLCDLQPVGQALAQSFTGLPISGRVSESLLPLFAQLNNDALYRTLLRDLAPRNVCPIISNIPNYSIDIKQLCGIWIISFGFSILGLIMTIFRPMLRHRNMRMARVQPVLGYDQFGNDYKRIEFEVIEPRSQESVRRRRSSTTSKSAWTIEQAPLVKDFSDEESSSDAYPRHQKRPKELYIGASPSRSQSSQITLKVRNATQVPEHPRALLMNNTQPRFLPQMQEEQKIAVSSRTGRIELSIPPQLHPSKHDTPRMGESVQSRNKIYGSNLHARIISGSAECV
jgi:Ligand-gated ion channel